MEILEKYKNIYTAQCSIYIYLGSEKRNTSPQAALKTILAMAHPYNYYYNIIIYK